MANKTKYKLKYAAHPTHILVPDDTSEEERTMFLCDDGAVLFSDRYEPKRNCSYKLIPNKDYEDYRAEVKQAK